MTADDPRGDTELLLAHAEGDPEAFALLFRRHRDRLWAVALRTTGDREEAADALQEAMLSAHRNAGRFRGESAVTTWLHRIVVNACLDRLRRRATQPTVPLPGQDTGDDEERWRTGRNEPAAPAHDHDTAWWCGRRSRNFPMSSGPPWYLWTSRGTRWRRWRRCSGWPRARSRAGAHGAGRDSRHF